MLNVAIQGAGNVSTEHIRAYMNNPHTRVVAIGSRTLEGAKKKAEQMGLDCAVYDNYEDLLNHPGGLDIISICTPPHLHAQECIMAAERGIHVLVEKPIALNQKDVEAMAAAVRKAGVKSAVGFVLRWNPLIMTIKKAIKDGWVGRPLVVHADYWHGPQNLRPKGVQRSWEALAGGAMVQGGCHAVDAARFILDNELITQVSAVCPEDEPKEKQQITVSTVTFSGGAVGKISASQRFYMPYVFNIEVFGDEGVIRNNRFYSKQWPGQHDFVTLPTVVPDSGDVDHHPFQGLIDHLVECIQTDTESHNSIEVAVNTHAACFGAEQSAADGSAPVKLV
ncbi:MAG: Gfo/Idh/MocA family oxidoreductase [Firmicutes bacterium]|nr:Gfo/Idh/MocA family oxidoreductase [Bacillota bacterium]